MPQKTGRINYSIEPNSLQEGTYKAVVHYDRKLDSSYLIQSISEKTALNNSAIQSVVLALVNEVGKETANGNIVVIDGLASFRAVLRLPSTVTDPNFQITSDNAKLSIDTRALPEIKDEVEARATYHRVPYVEKSPVISTFDNLITGATDSFKVGDVISLKGEHLKGNPTDDNTVAQQQGVFLIETQDNVETRVSTYLKHTDKHYEFIVPAKSTGDYSSAIKIEVRTIYTPNGTLRTGAYPHVVNGQILDRTGLTPPGN